MDVFVVDGARPCGWSFDVGFFGRRVCVRGGVFFVFFVVGIDRRHGFFVFFVVGIDRRHGCCVFLVVGRRDGFQGAWGCGLWLLFGRRGEMDHPAGFFLYDIKE